MFLELGAWVCCIKQYIAVSICAIVFTHLYNINTNIVSKCVLQGAEPLTICSGWYRTHTHKHNTILWYRSVSDYMSAPYHVPQHGISYIDYAI